MKIDLRLMQESDLPQVASLEQQWDYLSKWGIQGFRSVLLTPSTYLCLVAQVLAGEAAELPNPQEDAAKTVTHQMLASPPLAGFAILALLGDHCELCNIVVRPQYLALGVGQALLDRCLEAARYCHTPVMFLEVRQSNRRAIRFYERNGFTIFSQRKNYYVNPHEHAWEMKKTL